MKRNLIFISFNSILFENIQMANKLNQLMKDIIWSFYPFVKGNLHGECVYHDFEMIAVYDKILYDFKLEAVKSIIYSFLI